jgi:8-hydroxy-5-deazaflavin:NADPH oxidoreductase
VHIGILGGTGPAGRSMAARLASVGYDVTVGSRVTQRAHETCDALLAEWPNRGLNLRGGDNREAASAEVVIVATPWDSAAATAASVGAQVGGKVVISMGNALIRVGNELQPLALARGSVAGSVQAAVPDAFVAAAFQHLPAKELGDLDHPVDSDVLICSDHPVASSTAAEMTNKIPGLRALDVGRLANAGAIENFVAVIIGLNVRYKTRTGIRITGIEL